MSSNNLIKICAFSDGHGILPKIDESFDLMLIGGDNVDLYEQCSKSGTKKWYLNNFVDWVNNLPFNDDNSKIVIIAGNHEVALELFNRNELDLLWNTISINTNNRVIYLQNFTYVFHKGDRSLTIFGTPYCKIFGNWAYMRDKQKLSELYSQMPEKCDILLSHDAPFGVSDLCYDWIRYGKSLEHIGNYALREAIIEKQPKYCLHGHLHSSNHKFETLDNTQVCCISLVNEAYTEAYMPLYLEF